MLAEILRAQSAFSRSAGGNNVESPTSSSTTTNECRICGALSNGYHFNAPSCSACAAFFRRTVTLNRTYICEKDYNCSTHFDIRSMCRSCRYRKCLEIGMDRKAVQPRRTASASGRRLVPFYKRYRWNIHAPGPQEKTEPAPEDSKRQIPAVEPVDDFFDTLKNIGDEKSSPENLLGKSYPTDSPPTVKFVTESATQTDVECPQRPLNGDEANRGFLDNLLAKERLFNERRKILYCSSQPISALIVGNDSDDIPFLESDLRKLTFAETSRHIRPQILLCYEWARSWSNFKSLDVQDKLNFMRRCVLYHTVLDPAYFTVRLGLPLKFVFFNGMFLDTDGVGEQGWEDEPDCISADMKETLYRPLMNRVISEICEPMIAYKITYTEFVFLKEIVSFKAACCLDISIPLRTAIASHLDETLKSLNGHYVDLGMVGEEIAERTGCLILLVSNIFSVGMETKESHHKITFFDLWKLDDLLASIIAL